MDHNYNMIISYSTRYKYKSPRASMLMLPSPQLQVTNVTHQICNLSGLSLISVQARHLLLANRFPSLLDLQTPWVFKKNIVSIYPAVPTYGRSIKNQDWQWFQTISSTRPLSTPTLRLSRSGRSLCRCQLFSLATLDTNKNMGKIWENDLKTSLTQPPTSMIRWDHVLMLISETSLGMDGSMNEWLTLIDVPINWWRCDTTATINFSLHSRAVGWWI